MVNPTPEQLLAAVKELTQQYEESVCATQKLTEEVGRRKKETRRYAIVGFLVGVIVVVGGLVVRHNDRALEADRRHQLARQLIDQREDLVLGCERANDQRRTLGEIISRAVQPSPVPPTTTDPEILAVLEQNRQRIVKLRAELLALPGVQIVDCQRAFPPPALDDK